MGYPFHLPDTVEHAGGTLTKYLAPAVVTIPFGVTMLPNAAQGTVFAITLTASTGTISNPINSVDGQIIRFRIIQDGSGSRTVSWGSAFDWGTGNSAVTLSTAANKVDIIGFEYVASLGNWCYLSAAVPQGF